MFILLIFLTFIILTVWTRRAIVGSWRESFVLALTACGIWIWATTELLSHFHFICFSGVAVVWAFLGFMASVALWCEKKPVPVIKISWISLSWTEKIILGFLAVIIMTTIVNALNSPPNTWDALTYHMSRVAHWIQNRSVEFYPTHIPRQLFSNPWLEYTILQCQVLSAGDYWASTTQWFCMIGSLIAVSLIAREMGLSRRSQWLAVLVAATVPIGIIESTSVQGDYAATLWVSCSLFAFLNYRRTGGNIWVLTCGSSLGLACLSKGTAIIFILPIIFWLFWDAFQPYIWKKLAKVVFILLIMVSINSLFLMRNMELFHQKMLGPVTEKGVSLINDAIDYQTFTANLLRNIGMHLGTPSQKFNRFIEESIRGLAGTLHVNLDDPRATFSNFKFDIDKPSRDENTAAAPLHLGLFLSVSIFLFFRRETYGKAMPYLCCILTMALIFLLVVRWQPWIIRFQLPLLILFAPLCAVVSEEYDDTPKNMAMIVILFVVALPYMFDASPRHLIGPKSLFHEKRMDRYFLGNSALRVTYTEGANEILKDGCQNVGLILGADSWEYPLWALLAHDHPWKGRMEHVSVDNLTKGLKYPLGSFEPCQIIVIGDDGLNRLRLGDTSYTVTNIFGEGNKKIYVLSVIKKIIDYRR